MMKDIVILCGGLGRRFQRVSSKTPKILAEIKPGITMLDWFLIDYLPNNNNVILAVGHLKDSVKEFVNKKGYSKKVIFSSEDNKLGTGGALIKASRVVNTKEFIAINGDTLQEVKFSDFIEKSKLKGGAKINIGCTTNHFNDSGKVLVDSQNFITNFSEKRLPITKKENNIKICTSIGLYNCDLEFFRSLPIENQSLEEDILPEMVKMRIAMGSLFKKNFYDFGTLDRYNNLIGN